MQKNLGGTGRNVRYLAGGGWVPSSCAAVSVVLEEISTGLGCHKMAGKSMY